jgi:hypothetical protein
VTTSGYPIEDYLRHRENTLVLSLPGVMGPLDRHLAERKRAHEKGLEGIWPAHHQRLQETPGEVMVRQGAATHTCRFISGFASEGMLCNEPPIPLRVLDFLGTYELVNLSLVCKAMHQAGHLLLEREVRGSIPRLCKSANECSGNPAPQQMRWTFERHKGYVTSLMCFWAKSAQVFMLFVLFETATLFSAPTISCACCMVNK